MSRFLIAYTLPIHIRIHIPRHRDTRLPLSYTTTTRQHTRKLASERAAGHHQLKKEREQKQKKKKKKRLQPSSNVCSLRFASSTHTDRHGHRRRFVSESLKVLMNKNMIDRESTKMKAHDHHPANRSTRTLGVYAV